MTAVAAALWSVAGEAACQRWEEEREMQEQLIEPKEGTQRRGNG
jgi:hypothetical protein